MTLDAQRHVLPVFRLLSLLVLSSVGTVLLVRSAPGYFSRVGEMDAAHSQVARQQAEAQRQGEGSVTRSALQYPLRLLHGDLGESQQYRVPVSSLLPARLHVTARVLLPAVLLAPLLALLCALPCSLLRVPLLGRMVAVATLFGIAVPVSVLASASLLSGLGGPVLVLLAVVAARDFRFFLRLLQGQARAPYLLHARACGTGPVRAVLYAVLLPVRGQVLNLLTLSFTTALGAVVPVEVIFGVPGIGGMAWNAAMNRDLPVLMAVTLLMAIGIGTVALLLDKNASRQPAGVVA